jgi:hypothetical protein
MQRRLPVECWCGSGLIHAHPADFGSKDRRYYCDEGCTITHQDLIDNDVLPAGDETEDSSATPST